MAALKLRKTYVARPRDIQPLWHLIDATGRPLGRLATQVATILQGKHRPMYTATIMTGDFVVVINASKVRFTGKKLSQKEYHFHSGYPGGLRTVPLEQMMQRSPTRVVEIAVKGMLPKTTLGGRMLKRLRVYAGDAHRHQAQLKGYGASEAGPMVSGSGEGHGGDTE